VGHAPVEDGSHDLRLVAVEDSLIETRSVFRATVSVCNTDRRVEVEAVSRGVAYGQPIVIGGQCGGRDAGGGAARASGAGSASVTEGRWSVSVPSRVGRDGEASVVARAVYPGGQTVRSAPLPIRVREPALIAPVPPRDQPTQGLQSSCRTRQAEGRSWSSVSWTARSRSSRRRTRRARRSCSPGLLKGASQDSISGISSDGQLKVSLHGKVVADATLASGGPRPRSGGIAGRLAPDRDRAAAAGKRPFLKVVMAGRAGAGCVGQGHARASVTLHDGRRFALSVDAPSRLKAAATGRSRRDVRSITTSQPQNPACAPMSRRFGTRRSCVRLPVASMTSTSGPSCDGRTTSAWSAWARRSRTRSGRRPRAASLRTVSARPEGSVSSRRETGLPEPVSP